MSNWFLVGLGGALGSMARYGVGLAIAPLATRFPLATLLVNVAGSTMIGVIYGMSRSGAASPATTLFFATGVLGGFTTFSAFSLQTVLLLEQNDWPRALLNIGLSVALCLAGVWLGLMLAPKS